MKIVRLAVPLLLLLIPPTVREQDAIHVPPLAQCRADADAWGIPGSASPATWDSPEDAFNQFKSKMDLHPPSSVLNSRNVELMQCLNTDRLYSSRYALASLVYRIEMFERMGHFMERHNLVSQFYDEDDQGKR